MASFSSFLRDKSFSSVKSIEQVLKNIKLHSKDCDFFLSLAEDLQEQAEASDRRRIADSALSAIDGIPISLKDNICTDWLPTTCASQMLKQYTPPFNAAIVEKIISLGGIIVGKTNMDEFGMGSHSLNSSFGKCIDYRTVNAKGSGKSFGGSSGGSAASIALGCSILSVGTDTGGSIRFPAHNSRLVGFKPSRGAISRYGIIPFSNYLDTVGILGRNSEEVETLFWLLAGQCPKDSTSIELQREEAHSFPQKFAIFCPSEQDKEILTRVFRMENFDFLTIPKEFSHSALEQSYKTISSCEAFSNLYRFDPLNEFSSTLKQEFKPSEYAQERQKLLGKEVQNRIAIGRSILETNSNSLLEAYQKADSLFQFFEGCFSKFSLIFSLTCSYAAEFVDEIQADSFDSTIKWTVPFSLSGHPTISIPIPNSQLSFQMTAPYGKDSRIFNALHSPQALLNKKLFK